MAKNLTTPKGIAVFPALNEPDRFTPPGSDKEQVKYKATLRFREDDRAVLQLIERLEVMRDEFWEEVKAGKVDGLDLKPAIKKAMEPNEIFEVEYDRETEEPTGHILLNIRCNAFFVKNGRKVSLAPALVDAARQPFPRSTPIWSGSTLKAAFTPVPYAMAATKKYGVSLRLTAVQVIDLVTRGNAGASAFEDEEGFSVEDLPAEEGFADETGDAEGSVDDDTSGTPDPDEDLDF